MKDDQNRIPLTEYDPDRKAVIEPKNVVRGKVPSEYCVMTFFGGVLRKLIGEGKLVKVEELQLPSPNVHPNDVYQMDYQGKTLMVAHPGVGASLAVGSFEELIALGCAKFVACGSSGALKTGLHRGMVVIPESAVRDEGASYHYCPPSREISMKPEMVNKLEKVLQKNGVNYEVGKTWTTDGFYRETKGKIAKRRAEGCIVVEMECSALLAVAEYRGVPFGQFLMAADDASGDEWDARAVENKLSFDEKVFWLSVEACLSL
jgi:uridine phosphorylase